jgi:AmmeMemoRadiSam system protein B
MSGIRAAAVAGSFYPGQAGTLEREVRGYLEAVAPSDTEVTVAEKRLKAVIVPHAGYIYSGPVAASAYAGLKSLAGQISRVVLLGPAHRVYLRGLAAPRAEAFDSPLGPLRVDLEATEGIAGLPGVLLDDRPHAQEHCLEVQLPFLQMILGDVSIIPLVVGAADAAAVAAVLERLWGGPETLIVLSTDLSHYLSYRKAKDRDARTAAAIEALDGTLISPEDACGAHALAGLLAAARNRDLTIERLDLRNSGDTAGPRDRVVGYGAWVLREKGG